jgi:hypothetical protein
MSDEDTTRPRSRQPMEPARSSGPGGRSTASTPSASTKERRKRSAQEWARRTTAIAAAMLDIARDPKPTGPSGKKAPTGTPPRARRNRASTRGHSRRKTRRSGSASNAR